MFREDREAVGNSWSVRSASIVELRLAVRPFTNSRATITFA
jgi:hypothetical protein